MPYVGLQTPLETVITASGVLAGTYPDPVFSTVLAKKTQVSGKSALRHLHDATAVSSGVASITRLPTSTAVNLNAVPRADDPRLNSTGSQEWDQYGSGASIAKYDVPTWNGSVYIPRVPPPPGSVVDATRSRKGGITLRGDLGGTAAAPKIVRRAPFGDTLEYTISFGGVNSGTLRVNPVNALRYRADSTFDITTNYSCTVFFDVPGIAGQIVTIELCALYDDRYANFTGSYATQYQGYSHKVRIPVNKIGVFRWVFSELANRWTVLSQHVET